MNSAPSVPFFPNSFENDSGYQLYKHNPKFIDLAAQLPSYLSADQLGDYIELKNSEAQTPRWTILNDKGVDRDFGFSFSIVNDSIKECLKEIKRRFELNNYVNRPQVLDIGAGLGLFTWKLAVSGGNVTAIELNQASAKMLRENFKKVKGFLRNGEKLKDALLPVRGDFFEWSDRADLEEKYEVVLASNFVHLLNPPQAEKFVQNLFKMVKNGGKVFASAHMASYLNNKMGTGSALNSHVDFFFANQASGAAFPGYYVFKQMTLLESVTYRKKVTETILKEENSGHLIPSSEFPLPGEAEKSVRTVISKSGSKSVVKVETPTVVHFFDRETLKTLFQKGGFLVEESDVYYIDGKGKKVTSPLESEDFKKGDFNVAIEATKPESL